MGSISWYDGKKWHQVYKKQLDAIEKEIEDLENMTVNAPVSDKIREDADVFSFNRDLTPDSGTGARSTVAPIRAQTAEETFSLHDAIEKLGNYAHRHAVDAIGTTGIVMERLCQCQCQCDCQCVYQHFG